MKPNAFNLWCSGETLEQFPKMKYHFKWNKPTKFAI